MLAQMVKRLSTVREIWVRSLGEEDTLEKEMATHSSTLAWRIPWIEEPGRLRSMGSQESDTTEHDHEMHTSVKMFSSKLFAFMESIHPHT